MVKTTYHRFCFCSNLRTVVSMHTPTGTTNDTSAFDVEMDRVAWRIATHGLRGSEDALRRLAGRARRCGVSSVLTEVLTDPTEPEVARIRAFGLVSLRLARIAPHVDRAA